MNETHPEENLLVELLKNQEGDGPDPLLLEHIDSCKQCQMRLENLAADASWWTVSKECFEACGPLSEKEELNDRKKDLDPFRFFSPANTNGTGNENLGPTSDLKQFESSNNLETLGRIDEFEVESRIGQGGMGIVYRGFDHSLNRPVAIKIMLDHLSENQDAQTRFRREAQAAAAVVHPNIIPIHKVGTSIKKPYIAMAFVDGDSLQQWVEKKGPCEVLDVVRISLQVTSALAAAHRVGLIHRDIKPANVLMEKDVSRVVLTDFGLAKAVDDVVMTQSGTLAGTPAYMSPEHINGKNLDSRSDLFSLGGLMYFLCTGKEPFSGTNAFSVINQIMRSSPTSVKDHNPKVPQVLAKIIERLLEKDAQDRFQSADELEKILENLLAHLHHPNQNVAPSIGMLPSLRRKVLQWALFSGTVIAGVVVAVGLSYTGVLFSVQKNPEHVSKEKKESDRFRRREIGNARIPNKRFEESGHSERRTKGVSGSGVMRRQEGSDSEHREEKKEGRRQRERRETGRRSEEGKGVRELRSREGADRHQESNHQKEEHL